MKLRDLMNILRDYEKLSADLDVHFSGISVVTPEINHVTYGFVSFSPSSDNFKLCGIGDKDSKEVIILS